MPYTTLRENLAARYSTTPDMIGSIIRDYFHEPINPETLQADIEAFLAENPLIFAAGAANYADTPIRPEDIQS